ncbi:MAG: endopeptidase La [Anaerobiospirillum succiniciproducens]|uniref:endopeptidase La n=1 Tax=Anaerobiospirillum succiniciproducens TaxID=13335 RepID=UPI002A753DE7|nr:endopeptidase La [Anaerobiospirillum succiniciproducens]MDY2799141.1 endopeptidase La [Anaerobiospirillum succiniciproducens]
MAEFDDIKTMLNSLLVASPLNMGSEEKSDNEYKIEDGYDNDNPLAMTDLYRDELGNRLPSKLHVVPLYGRPILPSQITTIQLSIEWLDVITEVISSSHHTFAMFAVDNDKLKKSHLAVKDFPKTGTVVRLLSARSGPEEIDIVCEGVRRVSLIEVADIRKNLAQVRYPEIEYRLANPSTRDKLNANNQALRDSIDRSVAFDKKLQNILKEMRDYGRSIGIDVQKKPGTFDFNYFIFRDDRTIGRLSKAKLDSLFDFIGYKDLSDDEKYQIAMFLARPTKDELNKLNSYYSKAVRIITERSKQLHEDLAHISPKAREIAQSIIGNVEKSSTNGSPVLEAIKAISGKNDTPNTADKDKSNAVASAADAADADAAAAAAASNAAATAEGAVDAKDALDGPASNDGVSVLSGESQLSQTIVGKDSQGNDTITMRLNVNDDDEINDKTLSDIAKQLSNMFSITELRQKRQPNNDQQLVGVTSKKGQAEIDSKLEQADNKLSYEFMERISKILEDESDRSASYSSDHEASEGHSREDLFNLIAKIGEREEEETARAKKDFKDAALKEIIANTPKDETPNEEPVTGPNIGFINNDTAVVTFMPGRDSSEDLLLRLTEIQNEHEQQLAKEASAAETIKAADDAEGYLSSLDNNESEGAQMHIIGDVQNEDGSQETNLVVSGEGQIKPELKEFLSFLMKGKDLAQITADMDEVDELDDDEGETKGSKRSKRTSAKSAAKGAEKRSGKWGDLQRAAMIRSKLASILGGKVVFGVSSLNERQAGAQKEVETRAYCLGITAALQEMIPLNPMITEEMRQYLSRFDISNPSTLADCAASITQSKPEELQEVLDTIPILPRLKLTFDLISRELSAAKLQDKIKVSVSDKIQKRQKDFFLREQLNEIKKELGLSADEKDIDIEKFKERMAKLNPPEHIKARFNEEIEKLSMLETSSSEYGTTRNYVDIITSIPWGKMSKERLASNKSKDAKKANAVNLERARKILDEDHEGLQDVKDRIIEFLAVGALKGHTSGQIMLFVGPPGVGKTSIGKSIAKALNRPFYRLSLGGIDDVSEIKGHRKTYVGAMPGKIVSALRETKVMNPVIMLDEIDKLGKSYHGDPDSALLETLDPEQNKNFLDVYLDEKMDLSNCLFICTANSTETISAPLLDRMDPIRLSGYIAKEKFAIAKKHLLPRALENAGMKRNSSAIRLPDECLTALIDGYARESGVRSLERSIAKLIRKAAVKLIQGESKVIINESDLETYLGTAPFKREKLLEGIGIQTGLAWTASGGVTLPVESIITSHDTAGFKLTGSLGDVMKESASIALSYVQSHLNMFCSTKTQTAFFKKKTVHLHVPEGAIPKDGPSAGVTMATSLLSLALNTAPAARHAMTGELTLTGHVLPIGGLREKVIAARRVGIFDLIIPIGNEGDVKELPEHVRSGVTFYFADKYEDVAYTLFTQVQPLIKKALPGYKGPKVIHFDDDGLYPEDAKNKADKAQSSKATTKVASKVKTAANSTGTPGAASPRNSKASTGSFIGDNAEAIKQAGAAKRSAAKASTAKKTAATKTTAAKVKAPAAKKPAAAKTTAASKTKAPAAKKATSAKSTAASKAKTPVAKKPVAAKTSAAASKAKAPAAKKPVAAKSTAASKVKAPAAKKAVAAKSTAASKAKAPVAKKPIAAKATAASKAKASVAKKPVAAKSTAASKAKAPVAKKATAAKSTAAKAKTAKKTTKKKSES